MDGRGTQANMKLSLFANETCQSQKVTHGSTDEENRHYQWQSIGKNNWI